MKESFRMKPVRSRLNWARHVKRMEGGLVTKGADALRVSCKQRRRRPGLRWEGMENESSGGGSCSGWWRRQKTGTVMEDEGKHTSRTPESREKEESNNITVIFMCCPNIIFVFIHNIISNETINGS